MGCPHLAVMMATTSRAWASVAVTDMSTRALAWASLIRDSSCRVVIGVESSVVYSAARPRRVSQQRAGCVLAEQGGGAGQWQYPEGTAGSGKALWWRACPQLEVKVLEDDKRVRRQQRSDVLAEKTHDYQQVCCKSRRTARKRRTHSELRACVFTARTRCTFGTARQAAHRRTCPLPRPARAAAAAPSASQAPGLPLQPPQRCVVAP